MIAITIGQCACGYRGTLVNGACGFCDDAAEASARHLACSKVPAPVPAPTISDLFALLVEELAEDCPAPLAQRLTLGHIWIDLCRLAGEPVPAHVAAMLDEPAHTLPLLVPTTHRGSFKEYSEEFYLPA